MSLSAAVWLQLSMESFKL